MINKKKVLITGIAIIAIASVGATAWYCINNKKGETVEKQSTNTQIVYEVKPTNEAFVGELSDGTKINTNAKMNAPSTVGNYEISNVRLTLKNGVTTFKANVKNNSDAKTDLKTVTLKLLDDEGKELVSAKGIIQDLEAGASADLNISITSKYINACGYEIVEN